ATARLLLLAPSCGYQPGAVGLPVVEIGRLAVAGAAPPDRALPTLKDTAKPVYRTRVGKFSARKLARLPSLRVSIAPSNTWTSSTMATLPVLSNMKAGTVNTVKSTDALIRTFLRPNRSER